MSTNTTIRTFHAAVGFVAAGLLTLLALAATAATVAAAAGVLPWLQVAATFGETVVPWAGLAIQIAVTVILVALSAMVPALLRVGRLEAAHRSFSMGMDDVARAYHVAHAQDRKGAFRLKSEFDAVRERLALMKDHPDLAGLEPGVLELAAQMSTQTRKLAETYSDEAVERAQRFLQQREEEVERSRELIARAHHSARELKRWTENVELEEQVLESQLGRLEEDMDEILPRLGYAKPASGANVVQLPGAAAE